jgi:putative ABC transport system permease protein
VFINDLKIGFRNLRRRRSYAALNIIGLAIGIACCLLIWLYVQHEMRYDGRIPNAGRLFRVVTRIESNTGISHHAGTPVPLGPALRRELPEVRRTARFWQAERETVRTEDKAFAEDEFYFADPEVLSMFGFSMVNGDPGAALSAPDGIVITRSAAIKYFGREEALGKVMTVDGYPVKNAVFRVTGVIEDPPEDTQFAFSFLASIVGVATEADNWGSTKSIWTYVELHPGATAAGLEGKLAAFVDAHFQSGYQGQTRTLSLEPLRRVHLHSRYEGGFKPRGDIATVLLFAAIGFLILLIACMNFINLSTALSFARAREVGVRKVLGADRGRLIRSFLTEGLIIAGCALALGLVLTSLSLPAFNALAGRSLSIDGSNQAYVAAVAAVVLLGVGLLAGAYPAIALSSYRPLAVLRGRFTSTGRGARLRKALVVFQFAVSILLIVATTVISRQLKYMQGKNLGITRDQILVVPYSPAADAIRAALLQNPRIVDACVSQRVPVNTENGDSRPLDVEGIPDRQQIQSYIVDTHFLDTYGLRLVAGTTFPERFPEEETPFLINETAVKRFGWRSPDQALGARVRWSVKYKTGRIVGVVNDFHLTSIHEEIAPLVLLPIPEDAWWRTFMSVRLRPENVSETVAFVTATWRRLTPGGAFRSFFIDESFGLLHREDERLAKIVDTFAGLSVFLACLGLYGLGTYAAKQRTREIGIRKVLGAHAPSIVGLLSGEFLRLVLASNLLAWPVAYFVMTNWLGNFAYRIALGPGPFMIAGAAALAIAMATVSAQSVKAALSDPVKAIRYE